MKKEMLVAEIMSRAGSLGDAKLVSLIGELLKEVTNEDAIGKNQKVIPGSKYVVCVEATMNNGQKVQHPVIGGGYGVPSSVDGYKMTIGDDLIKLQRDTEYMKSAIEGRLPVKVRYVPVTDEAVSALEEKLSDLINNLVSLIDEVAEKKQEAYNMMHVEVEPSDITNDMVADVMRKTIYAGACLNEAGEVVDRTEEKYVEEQRIDERNNSSKSSGDDSEEDEYSEDEDNSEDDEWDPDTCDGCCEDCCGRNECEDSCYSD